MRPSEITPENLRGLPRKGYSGARIVLLVITAYEALGCLAGGTMLVAQPDGSLMRMPVSIMHHAFESFFWPGALLFCLGLLNSFAFIAVLRKRSSAWFLSSMAMGGLAIWFWIEIAILLELHWLHAMWGLPVLAGAVAAAALLPGKVRVNVLLACGILSSLLYLAINIVVPMKWLEYDLNTQTISELSAIGAPTRMLWIILSAPYTLLVIAFAFGIMRSAGSNNRLRTVGKLVLVYGMLGLLWPAVPMHLRPTLAAGGGTITDSLHLALGAVTDVLYLVTLTVAAGALGRAFRIYSFATFLLLLVFGILTFQQSPGIASGEPTPYIGLFERVNITLFLVWIIVLGLILMINRSGRLKNEGG